MVAMPPKLIQPKEAAAYLATILGRCSVRTLQDYRTDEKGPAYYVIGEGPRGRIMYAKEDLDAWLESCRRVPTKSTAPPSSPVVEVDREPAPVEEVVQEPAPVVDEQVAIDLLVSLGWSRDDAADYVADIIRDEHPATTEALLTAVMEAVKEAEEEEDNEPPPPSPSPKQSKRKTPPPKAGSSRGRKRS